jgi:glycosyltransferase involved in cell wall biosynthesis
MVRVSTIIPAYNAERTIAQAIDSALSQDYKGHQVVVINDGSTDSTAAILEKYGDQIQVVTQNNGGLSAARNAGVRRSTSEYLAFLDADDIWLPGKLKTMVLALVRNPQASLAFSDYILVDENGAKCGESAYSDLPRLEQLMTQRPLPVLCFKPGLLPSTWVIPRQILESIGGFCEAFKGSGGFDDHWMLLVLREQGEFVYVPEKLTVYRTAESGKVADKYGAGVATFISLVKERYGTKSKSLIRTAKSAQSRSLLSKMAFQMNNADRLGALRSLAGILRLYPGYFVTSEFVSRLCLLQNTERLRKLIFSLPRARNKASKPMGAP